MQMSSAHRACDGDRPARYLKRGAAKLDRRVHEAGCRLCKSERSRVGSSRITNEESDPLRGVGWRVRNQPDPNEEARWMANASPATDQERCPIDVDTGHCRPAPPVVERSYARAGRLNECRAVGQARRRSLRRHRHFHPTRGRRALHRGRARRRSDLASYLRVEERELEAGGWLPLAHYRETGQANCLWRAVALPRIAKRCASPSHSLQHWR